MRHFTHTLLIMGLFSGLFGCNKDKSSPPEPAKEEIHADSDESFPPVPEWEPDIDVPLDQIVDRFAYYTDGGKDFVVFTHGTCAIVSDGLSDAEAADEAKGILSQIFNYHPDMNPQNMDDGNILISYNHPAYNVVLDSITTEHMKTIKQNHQKALARAEVLITPLGNNKFDEFGMKALFGRCYFFMDAKNPAVSRVVRKTNSEQDGAGQPPTRTESE